MATAGSLRCRTRWRARAWRGAGPGGFHRPRHLSALTRRAACNDAPVESREASSIPGNGGYPAPEATLSLFTTRWPGLSAATASWYSRVWTASSPPPRWPAAPPPRRT